MLTTVWEDAGERAATRRVHVGIVHYPTHSRTHQPTNPPLHEALLGLEPVEGGGEGEAPQEAWGFLLRAGRARPPLFQPRPEVLDAVAIEVLPKVGDGRG